MDIQKRPVPRVLAPALLRELAEENPLGLRLTPEEVGGWWKLTWPRYKTYRYRNHGRAVRSWWSRVTPRELAAARAVLAAEQDQALREQEERLREDVGLLAIDSAVLAAIFGRR